MFNHLQTSSKIYIWKFIFNVIDVIFKFGNLKRKTHKVQRNNASSKTFKNMFLRQRNWKKKTKIATHMDL